MEWIYTEDDYGIYGKLMDGETVVAESTKYKQKWYDENPPAVPEPQKPTAEEKIAVLEEENAMLQMSIMELAMYAAVQEETLGTQDARITTQESAVMELSMLIAGGMMDV